MYTKKTTQVFILILLLALLLPGHFSAEEATAVEASAPVFELLSAESTPAVRPAETPVPVKTARPSPVPTPEIPVIIDRTVRTDEAASFRFRLDAQLLHIWFPNIMNADEAVLLYQDQVWMIDCGDIKAGGRGAEMLAKLGITKVDKLFNSHPHHDHLDGLALTHTQAPVEELWVCFGPAATDSMIKATAYAEENGILIREYRSGDIFSMGDGGATLQFYNNTNPELKDMNDQSAITMIRIGERSILFLADMEKRGQIDMMERLPASSLKADILKYPHHGKSAMYEPFLEAVDPQLAIVTNLKAADTWEGIRYLRAKAVPFLYTNKGAYYLHLVTDGEHWIVEYVAQEQL